MIGPATAPPRTIVGVVGDVRHQGLDRPLAPQVYVPQAQWVWAETLMTLVVRTTGEPTSLAGAVRGVVRDVDPAQPVTDVAQLRRRRCVDDRTRRFVAGALGVFAALALVLAMVGLYGALSVTVAQRRLEIGIRLALGARAEAIRRMVFMNGLRPVIAGAAVGGVAALVALRGLAGLLFEVRPADPAHAGRGAGAAGGGRGGGVRVAGVAGVAHRSGAVAARRVDVPRVTVTVTCTQNLEPESALECARHAPATGKTLARPIVELAGAAARRGRQRRRGRRWLPDGAWSGAA